MAFDEDDEIDETTNLGDQDIDYDTGGTGLEDDEMLDADRDSTL